MSLHPVYALRNRATGLYVPRSQASQTPDKPKLWVVRAQAEIVRGDPHFNRGNVLEVVTFDLVERDAAHEAGNGTAPGKE
jgi:hypothetical protein